jgi:uncharacterized protein YjgD (DUF1641 family)
MNNTLVEELRTIQEKADKYDYIKDRNDSYAEKLADIIEALQKLAKEITPYTATKIRKPYSKGNKNEELSQIYKLMQGGTQITSKLLEKTYPEFTTGQRNNLMTKISKIKGVQRRNEGRNVFYYL